MRPPRKLIAILLALVLLLSTTALADAYVKFTGNARCYKKPGGKKTEVVIKKGSTSFAEDGIGKKWTKVFVDEDTDLWVKSKYLKELSEESVKVRFVSGGKGRSTYDEDEGAHSYKTSKKYVYATGKCNIRKSPGLDGKSLGTLKKGGKLKYLGKRAMDDREVYWYKVRTKSGKTGWVSSTYAKLK